MQSLTTVGLCSSAPSGSVGYDPCRLLASQAPQEIQQVLFPGVPKCAGSPDHGVGFRRREAGIPSTRMRLNRLDEVGGSAIVQQEDPLPEPHRGAVRNSSDPATPWTMSSASRGPRLNLDFTQELPRKLLPTRAKEGHTYLREKRLFTTRCLWRGGCGVDSRRAHNPKVAGSNPAPATIDDEGLADVSAANPFRLPRLHPGIGRHRTWARDSCCETAVPRSRLQGILQAWTECGRWFRHSSRHQR